MIDKDVILTALLDSCVPENMAQPASYRAMFALGEAILHQQTSIILDSPAALPATVVAAQGACHPSSAQLITILCSAEQQTRNERVATRTKLPSQPIGVSSTTGRARDRFVHLPDDTIEADTMKPLDIVTSVTIAAILVRLLHPQA